jgi:methylated-DNA-protein-cysteine methyltransferase-like protein
MTVPPEITDHIIEVVDEIPAGRCMTYGSIGDLVGIGPRYVARVMSTAPEANAIPWHRVVGAGGHVKSGSHKAEQLRRLRDEGFALSDDRITDFSNRLYIPDEEHR